MNSSFEYLDIIILAMIAGFIILRLRGILGRRTGHEKKIFGNSFFKRRGILKRHKLFNLNYYIHRHIKYDA